MYFQIKVYFVILNVTAFYPLFIEPVIENGLTESDEGPGKEILLSKSLSDEAQTDNGPLDKGSSDEETVRMQPKRCHRLRTPLSEPGYRDKIGRAHV